MDLGEFGRLLDSVRSGSDGVALFALGPVLSLVTEEESHANMPRGADELVRRWVQGQSVAPTGAAAPAARPDVVDVKSRSSGKVASQTSDELTGREWFLWGASSGAMAVGLLWAVRARSRRRLPPVPELPLAVLEALATELELTGPQAALIVRRLQALKPTELERIQAKKSHAETRHWDRFVQERLGESLMVTCPTCGSMLSGLWLRPTMGCPSCHHRFLIEESPAVTIHDVVSSDVPASLD
jgi:hypothetical protein